MLGTALGNCPEHWGTLGVLKKAAVSDGDLSSSSGAADRRMCLVPWRRRKMGWWAATLTSLLAFFLLFFFNLPEVLLICSDVLIKHRNSLRHPTAARRKVTLLGK